MKRVAYHTPVTLDGYQDMTPPRREVWEWVKKNLDGEVHIIEETNLPTHVNYNGIKIASILETPSVYNFCKQNNPSIFDPFEWIKTNHQHFTFVMSPFKFLKDVVGEEKYLYVPVGGSRIKLEDFGMYEKERMLSIVASHKTWTEGHKLRHEIVKRYPGKIDVYGSGYNNTINEFNGKMGKIISLAPYYFTLAVMNSTFDDYFTEVITDAFAVGTVPLWWGSDKIGTYFNPSGIIQFKTLDELDRIIPTLTPELYTSKREAIVENIDLAKKYVTHFDWIYDNYKGKFESL
jgi:hypothetical protein